MNLTHKPNKFKNFNNGSIVTEDKDWTRETF